MRKLLALFLCLSMAWGLFPITALAAPEWPSGVSVQAEGGIVMDADTGTVLYGQNIHERYFPASITKIMTGLLIAENCDLDDMVTFSHNAVFNVEVGSSNAGINVGETMSVRDCLYALLLRSANEAANALAEHLAGSTEAFVAMMNERAAALGCTDTNFANTNGLNNPDHYSSPYDMALIASAALENPVFSEIDSTISYKLPPTKNDPEGLDITHAHRMLKNSRYYYPGCIGGKTGYTSLAGNTLVTCAERDGMRLVAVIMKGTTPQYWTDTKSLLDFGFDNFKSVKASDSSLLYDSLQNDMTIAGLTLNQPSALVLDPNSHITLPKSADFSGAAMELSYDLTSADPPDAVAKVQYTYNDRKIGSAYLQINPDLNQVTAPVVAPTTAGSSVESSAATITEPVTVPATVPITMPATAAPPEKPADKPFQIPTALWVGVLVFAVLGVLIGAAIFARSYIQKREERERRIRRARRQQRLQDAGYSTDDFEQLMKQRKSSYTTKRHRKTSKYK